jgi:pimeloyl-ACP methyl ester carboxylesterase
MAEEKTRLILLPGLLCTPRLWQAPLAALADIADMTVGDLTRHDSMAGMAGHVLDGAPERFALAGLSMGGYVALEIMRRAPERVERLALLDTSARPDDPTRTAERHELLALVEEGRFEEVNRRLLALQLHPDRLEDDPALCEAVLGMAREVGADAYLRQVAAIMGRPDSRPGLGAIACPTLVLCGEQDRRTPPSVHEEMAGMIPGAQLVVVPESGHLSPMEQAGPVNAALRGWLG